MSPSSLMRQQLFWKISYSHPILFLHISLACFKPVLMYRALFQHLPVYCPLEKMSLRNSQMYILLMSCVSESSPALFALNKSWQCPLTRRQDFLSKCIWENPVLIDNSDNTPKGLWIIQEWSCCLPITQNRSSECWSTWVDALFLPYNLRTCLSSEFLERMKGGEKCIGRIIVRCHIKCHWDISVTQTFTFSHL